MATRFVGPLPDVPNYFLERLYQIIAFWEGFDVCGNPGETTMKELEALREQCFAALKQVPMDLAVAESLTAYAALLMSGPQSF